MQPLTKHREVSSGGVTESSTFGISVKDEGHIKSILRDAIYSDKILAVLREYSANAWDAHRMVGKHDLPIEVHIPTYANPTLIIKDFGPGLSHEDVFNVFTQYGASTKRGSNDAVGMLGIGSKSGFAYSDTFTVISRHAGKKRTYVALLDEDENDAISLLAEEDCGDDTGVTIQIAARAEDVREFETKAKTLFEHFNPRPKTNIILPVAPEIKAKLKEGIVYTKSSSYYDEGKWFAVMGCIPYKIDLDQLKGSDGESLISETFRQSAGLLYFNIGEVQINASREALKYSKVTKEALVKKFEATLDEYIATVLKELDETPLLPWDRRLKLISLLDIGLGKDSFDELAEEKILLGRHDHKTFETNAYYLQIREETRFVRNINPENKKFNGYHLKSYDILIDPKLIKDPFTNQKTDKPYSWGTIEFELQQFIRDNQLDGITVVDLCDLPWEAPYVAPRRKYSSSSSNPKHSASVFKLVSTNRRSYYNKLSDRWEVVKRIAQPDDVYVLIEAFESIGVNIYQHREEDEKIAQALGIKLPEIYAYKSTPKKPVDPTKIVGIPYLEWRKKFLSKLTMDRVMEIYQNLNWYIANSGYGSSKVTKFITAEVCKALGPNNQISLYLRKMTKVCSDPILLHNYSKYDYLIKYLTTYELIDSKLIPDCDVALNAITSKYPLLDEAGLKALWGKNASAWQDYIKLVDNSKILTPKAP